MTAFPQAINASASPEVQSNDNFAALTWAGTYSHNAPADSGLTRGYSGGRWGTFIVADNAHAFGASTTTYVSVLRSTGALNFSTTSTNYLDSTLYAKVETVVTSASAITSAIDDRGGPGGVHGNVSPTGGAASTSQPGEMISGFIGTLSNKTYKLVVKAAHAGTITETTTISASGTCTATFKINTAALGGAANSVSSTVQSQAQASANVFAAGDDIQLTVSANATCVDMSFTIKYTRTLA